MGFELRREVRAVIPPGKLTPLERLLALEIADQCNDATREGFPGAELLSRLVDKSERAVEEALKSIGGKWVELRVELGKGSDGRPYYSHRNKRTTFRIPNRRKLEAEFEKATGFPWASSTSATLPGALPRKAPGSSGASANKPPTFLEEAPDFPVESPRESRGPSPQGTPQNFNTSSLSTREVPGPPPDEQEERDEVSSTSQTQETSIERKLIAKRGVTGATINFVRSWIESNFNIGSTGWWIVADRNGSLDQHITDALAALKAWPEPATSTEARDCGQHPGNRANNCGPCAGERLGAAEGPTQVATRATTHFGGPFSRYSPARHKTNTLGGEVARQRPLSPADQRVAENQPLYEKYKLMEESA